MTRHPKPIPTLGDAWRQRTAIRRADSYPSFHRHNPAPEDFAANVIANHARTATVEAKRAHQYTMLSRTARHADWQVDAVRHATRAGEYAAYSGRPLEQWHAELGAMLDHPVVRSAFDAKYQDMATLLATPESELEDDDDDEATPNPARWPSSEVQSLLFDTEHWTLAAAKQWAKEHGFKYGNVESGIGSSQGYHHLRQFDPVRGRPCRTVTFEEDARGTIKARVCSG